MNADLLDEAWETEELTSRERVEEMLREIAFVLHMTRRVRDEIEKDAEAEELMVV
jgi:hypothetical protein